MFLTVDNLSVDIAGKRVLRDISFSLSKRQLLIAVGENGCGKTTLIRSICGIQPISCGEIRFKEIVVNESKPSELPVRLIPPFLPHMRACELISYEARRILQLPSDEIVEIIAEAIKRVGIDEELLSRHKSELSAGQQRRVQLAAALAVVSYKDRSFLLMLDEPMENIDTSRYELAEEFVELAISFGGSVIYVTHDREEAVRLSTRWGELLVMRNGQIEQIGSLADVIQHPKTPYVKLLFASWIQGLQESAGKLLERKGR